MDYYYNEQMSKPRYIFLIFLSVLLAPLLFLAGRSGAETSKTKPREEKIRSVIQEQLDAFNRDDYDAAYRFASRRIQFKFSRAEFELMVKGGYPQIAKSRRAVVGAISFSDEDRAAASVRITGKDRVTITANYRMVQEDGKWKIDGVERVEERRPVTYSRNTPEDLYSLPPHSA
jgi:hypothetical protein